MNRIAVCNQALRYIGAPEIVSMDQDTREANLCSRYYADAHIELLGCRCWDFSAGDDSARFSEALARRMAAALAVPLMNSPRLEQAMRRHCEEALATKEAGDGR